MKSAKRERRVWRPAFVLAAMGVLALLVVPQARSVGTPATPGTVQPGPVDKPALRAIVEEETRQRAARPGPTRPLSGPPATSRVPCRPRPTGC